MWQYFQLASKGAEKLKLFGTVVREKLLSLNGVFEAELNARILRKVREQKWLYDFKITQVHMDLHLLKLVEEKSISELVRLVSKPADLFEAVVKSLIKRLVIENVTDASWEMFKTKLKDAVKLATDDAILQRTYRASHFLQGLQTRLNANFQSAVVARYLRIGIKSEFDDLDNEPDDEFRKTCQNELEETINNQDSSGIKFVTLVHRITETVIKALRERKIRGAMSRCEACCPLCRSLCIREAGHDPLTLSHEAIHQPEGLGGVAYRGFNCLSPQICSQNKNENMELWRTVNGVQRSYFFRDWCKEYPNWEKPCITQEWPLREYIFYHFYRDFSKHYDKGPCINLPESYNRNLYVIRQNLEDQAKRFL